MTALRRWQEHVTACREARKREDAAMWHRLADWYDKWVEHNDYVDVVLSRLPTQLGRRTRVLEIGPGSGAFTLPLASSVGQVVAVEPSRAMREALRRNIAEADLTNVDVLPERVEEGLADVEGSFDLALASNSLYNVEPIDDVMRRLVGIARHSVILMGIGDQPEWYGKLHRRFRGADRVPSPHLGHFYPVLLELGIFADVEVVWISANYVYESEEDLLDWWAFHFHLGKDRHSELRSALLPLAERRGNRIGIYGRRRMALLRIESGRSF